MRVKAHLLGVLHCLNSPFFLQNGIFLSVFLRLDLILFLFFRLFLSSIFFLLNTRGLNVSCLLLHKLKVLSEAHFFEAVVFLLRRILLRFLLRLWVVTRGFGEGVLHEGGETLLVQPIIPQRGGEGAHEDDGAERSHLL